MRFPKWALALLGIFVAAAGRADAGLIVVSGDENITNPLVGSGMDVDAGNQRFFTNVLDGGSRVLVQGSDVGGIDTPVANINAFYNTLGGVTSAILAGPVTAASLSGVDLFLSAIPSSPFSATEIAALAAFVNDGGSVFLLGDGDAFVGARNTLLNDLLSGIGSSLRIVGADLDPGIRSAAPSQIAADPLTAGVTSFTYAFTSEVAGGTTLFTTTNGTPFIAYETTGVVPEPTGLVLTAMGLLFGAAGLSIRRRSRP